jgi:hypothetical protein
MSEAIVNDSDTLYETDLAAWAQAQADALRRRAANEIDWVNVAEEIEDVSGSQRREIRSRLIVVLVHLLKLAYQVEQRSEASWRGSIVEARGQIELIVDDSPSLRPLPAQVLAKAYQIARRAAAAQTGLSDLPDACPWTIDQVLDADFLP